MRERGGPARGLTWVSLLSVFAFVVHGYHPFTEDGGLYVAGIRKLLNPSLYPHCTQFVTAPMRFSLFAPLIAHLAGASHLRLETVLLVIYCAGMWATLYAAWMLTSRISCRADEQLGAVTLLACWLTMPIAGTSLMLMDPYVTARTLSTPLVLVSLAWALDGLQGRPRAWLLCGVSLICAAAMHPLMAGYGLATVLVLSSQWISSKRWRLCVQAVLIAAALTGTTFLYSESPIEGPDYLRAALTRSYWFPFSWHWYEQIGLIMPLLLLFWLRRKARSKGWEALASTGTQIGLIAAAIALLFCHPSYAKHLVASMQPLRAFHAVYEMMILLLGAWLGRHLLKAHIWHWLLLSATLGGIMFYVQRATFPNSAHLELPGSKTTNQWEQAFLWISSHTPEDALFALDADYITKGTGEDAQGFRAIAERSALADYSKDGGEASIVPALSKDWFRGETAQQGLGIQSDAERLARLMPLGVSWVVLEDSNATAWNCPYRNAAAKVCQLP